MKRVLIIILLLNLFQFCGLNRASAFEIKSPAFENNGTIPKQYTCDGINISPPLIWNNIPEGVKSLALISDDPDAPAGTWTHWIIFNMPPASKGLQEGVLPIQDMAHETKQGINDFKKIGYGGPCPPDRTHRYFFKLYALDTKLTLQSSITKKQLETAIKGHVVSQAELVGKYSKK